MLAVGKHRLLNNCLKSQLERCKRYVGTKGDCFLLRGDFDWEISSGSRWLCNATPEILRQLLQNLESLDKCCISPLIQPVVPVALHTKGEINLGKAKQSRTDHHGARWEFFKLLHLWSAFLCHLSFFFFCTLAYATLWQAVTAILSLRSQTSQYERLKYKRKQTSLQSFHLQQRKTQGEAVMEQLSEGTGSCIALIELGEQ